MMSSIISAYTSSCQLCKEDVASPFLLDLYLTTWFKGITEELTYQLQMYQMALCDSSLKK